MLAPPKNEVIDLQMTNRKPGTFMFPGPQRLLVNIEIAKPRSQRLMAATVRCWTCSRFFFDLTTEVMIIVAPNMESKQAILFGKKKDLIIIHKFLKLHRIHDMYQLNLTCCI